MLLYLQVALFGLAIGMIVSGIGALVREGRGSNLPKLAIALVIGVILSYTCAARDYPWRSTLRIVGIPFPAGALQLEGMNWVPFESPIAGLIMIGNGVILFALPLTPLGVAAIR